MNETTQPAIVQTLRGKIFPGEASPGRRLAEARLAQRLGISRTPLHHVRTI
ncbi:GntR family transcriptional regulator [Paraburkholderia sp. Ac-20336]|nr:GntR family transcriptional regulator [Paraburkholderia sp. Ac-20336]MBN3847460.1 GntR family transcriptional regulator [Paraburkholderia sp. Ac-20342]NIF77451.1 GntR family transcriptional regulator [Paraburkholderia sp. Cy-641]